MDEAVIYAKKYLEDLLSFFGLNTDVHATTDEDMIELSVPSTHLNGFLIGQHGDTMRAFQFIVSNALKNQGYEYTRVNVDIADYKRQRAHQVTEKAGEWIKQVKETGREVALPPMNAADRRTVHKAADEAGIITVSTGEGRERHVVLKPRDTSVTDTDTAE